MVDTTSKNKSEMSGDLMDPQQQQDEMMDCESSYCTIGFFNGILISLPIWGLIYFFFHILDII